MRTALAQVRLMVPAAEGEVGPQVSHENSLWTWVSAGSTAITPPSHANVQDTAYAVTPAEAVIISRPTSGSLAGAGRGLTR